MQTAQPTIQEIAQILRAVGGAALVIDYGEDRAQADTLQAVGGHKFVDVLSNPGQQVPQFFPHE